jgi:hypothetical protein
MILEEPKIFAFVLMPFNKAFDDIYKLGIKETATQLGILAERVDEQYFVRASLTASTVRSKPRI